MKKKQSVKSILRKKLVGGSIDEIGTIGWTDQVIKEADGQFVALERAAKKSGISIEPIMGEDYVEHIFFTLQALGYSEATYKDAEAYYKDWLLSNESDYSREGKNGGRYALGGKAKAHGGKTGSGEIGKNLKLGGHGGSLQGYIDITYKELVDAFGEPHDTMGDKTLAEWFFKDNGVPFTIYDYKNYGMDVHSIRDWHIGGEDSKAVDVVRKYFPDKKITNLGNYAKGGKASDKMEMKLYRSHIAESKKNDAKIGNLGWVSSPTSITSKTNKGILDSNINPTTEEITHKWEEYSKYSSGGSMAERRYPAGVLDKSKVGTYGALQKSGGGYLYDEVLEYRVWDRNEFDFFDNINEATIHAKKIGAEVTPLVLQKAGHWVSWDKDDKISIGDEDRIAEWRLDWLLTSKYSPEKLKEKMIVAIEQLGKMKGAYAKGGDIKFTSVPYTSAAKGDWVEYYGDDIVARVYKQDSKWVLEVDDVVMEEPESIALGGQPEDFPTKESAINYFKDNYSKFLDLKRDPGAEADWVYEQEKDRRRGFAKGGQIGRMTLNKGYKNPKSAGKIFAIDYWIDGVDIRRTLKPNQLDKAIVKVVELSQRDNIRDIILYSTDKGTIYEGDDLFRLMSHYAEGGQLGKFFTKAKDYTKSAYEKAKPHVQSAYEKSKELTEKGVAETKKAYGKAKKSVKDKIHDEKKKIAIEVLEATRVSEKLDGRKKDSQILNEATNIVEAEYAKGGKADEKILKEYRNAVDEYYEKGMKDFNGDKEMEAMFKKDKANHLDVIEAMGKGDFKNAYKLWARQDTASREVIANSAYELLMEKNGKYPTYAKGGLKRGGGLSNLSSEYLENFKNWTNGEVADYFEIPIKQAPSKRMEVINWDDQQIIKAFSGMKRGGVSK